MRNWFMLKQTKNQRRRVRRDHLRRLLHILKMYNKMRNQGYSARAFMHFAGKPIKFKRKYRAI